MLFRLFNYYQGSSRSILIFLLFVFKYCSLFLNQVRPPGHHAGIKQAMGFCLHNNAAVAALAAQAAGAKKVLIVDWVMSCLL